MLLAAFVVNAAGRTFSNDHLKISFSMPDDKWKSGNPYRLAPTPGWLVEYVNSINYSFIAFSGAKNLTDNVSAVATLFSMLKGECSNAWVVRRRNIRVGSYPCSSMEIRFVKKKLSYSGILLAFRTKGRQYRFIFGAMDNSFEAGFRDFLKVLSSVRVR